MKANESKEMKPVSKNLNGKPKRDGRKTNGGAREGAGRKGTGRESKVVYARVYDTLIDAMGKEGIMNATAYINYLIAVDMQTRIGTPSKLTKEIDNIVNDLTDNYY